jgi:hypothetical protein
MFSNFSIGYYEQAEKGIRNLVPEQFHCFLIDNLLQKFEVLIMPIPRYLEMSEVTSNS